MNALNKQLIHDETNSSSDLGGMEVDKQLEISEKSFKRKKKLLRMLHEEGFLTKMNTTMREVGSSSGGRGVDDLGMELSIQLKGSGASLVYTLTKKGNKCYFGARGSPSRLVTGQNLVQRDTEAKQVTELMEKWSCSAFEARSMIPFVRVEEILEEKKLNSKFFSASEQEDLEARRVSVYSVGYAEYVWFTSNRDRLFHFFATIATSSVVVDGESVPIAKMLGLTAKNWKARSQREGWEGRSTGLLVQKRDHSVLECQQLWYLKDQEVIDKKETPGGVNNSREERGLSVENAKLYSESVRVDNVFYAPYLKRWYNALAEEVRNGPTKEVDNSKDRIFLYEIAPLFSNQSILQIMISQMKADLGLRSLLLAPSTQRLSGFINSDKSPLSEEERGWLRGWSDADPVIERNAKDSDKVEEGSHKYSFNYVFAEAGSSRNRRLAFQKEMLEKEYLDLKLPYLFFEHLNSARNGFFATVREDKILKHYLNGTNWHKEWDAQVPSIQARIKKEVALSITSVRKELSLPPPLDKSRLLELATKERI